MVILCNKRPLLWPTSEDIKRGPGEVPSHRSGPCQIPGIGNASGHTPHGKSHRPPTWRRPVARNRASRAAGQRPCSFGYQTSPSTSLTLTRSCKHSNLYLSYRHSEHILNFTNCFFVLLLRFFPPTPAALHQPPTGAAEP